MLLQACQSKKAMQLRAHQRQVSTSVNIVSEELLWPQDPAVTMWRSQRGVDVTEEQGTKYRENALQVAHRVSQPLHKSATSYAQ